MNWLKTYSDWQSEYGIRHDDFERYRKQLAKIGLKLRRKLNLSYAGTSGSPSFESKQLNQPDRIFTDNGQLKDDFSDYLSVVLVEAERCWAHAMEYKQKLSRFQVSSSAQSTGDLGNRRQLRHQLIKRLRKAFKYAQLAFQLTSSTSNSSVPPQLKLDLAAYAQMMEAYLHFEQQANWKLGLTCLVKARSLLLLLQPVAGYESVSQNCIDHLEPYIRFCAYNIGGAGADLNAITNEYVVADSELLNQLSVDGSQLSGISALKASKTDLSISNGFQVQLTGGRKLAVENSTLASLLQKISNSPRSFSDIGDENDQIEQWFQQALDLAEQDIISFAGDKDGEHLLRLQAVQSSVKRDSFAYSIVKYWRRVLKLHLLTTGSILRFQLSTSDDDSVDNFQQVAVKPLEIAHLFEEMSRMAKELMQLFVFKDDPIFQQTCKALDAFFCSCKCCYLAEQHSQIAQSHQIEALELWQRVGDYVNAANNLPKAILLQTTGLSDLIDAHLQVNAQIPLVSNYALMRKSQSIANLASPSSALAEEGNELQVKPPHLIKSELPMAPVPTKPIFFDLAYYKVMDSALPAEFLVDESVSKKDQQQPSGGFVSSLVGGWFGGR